MEKFCKPMTLRKILPAIYFFFVSLVIIGSEIGLISNGHDCFMNVACPGVEQTLALLFSLPGITALILFPQIFYPIFNLVGQRHEFVFMAIYVMTISVIFYFLTGFILDKIMLIIKKLFLAHTSPRGFDQFF